MSKPTARQREALIEAIEHTRGEITPVVNGRTLDVLLREGWAEERPSTGHYAVTLHVTPAGYAAVGHAVPVTDTPGAALDVDGTPFTVGTMVEMTDINALGVVENITTHDDMSVYSIRCPYTGTLYSREAEDIESVSPEAADKVRQDMQRLDNRVTDTPTLENGDRHGVTALDVDGTPFSVGAMVAVVDSTLEALNGRRARVIRFDPSGKVVLSLVVDGVQRDDTFTRETHRIRVVPTVAGGVDVDGTPFTVGTMVERVRHGVAEVPGERAQITHVSSSGEVVRMVFVTSDGVQRDDTFTREAHRIRVAPTISADALGRMIKGMAGRYGEAITDSITITDRAAYGRALRAASRRYMAMARLVNALVERAR